MYTDLSVVCYSIFWELIILKSVKDDQGRTTTSNFNDQSVEKMSHILICLCTTRKTEDLLHKFDNGLQS